MSKFKQAARSAKSENSKVYKLKTPVTIVWLLRTQMKQDRPAVETAIQGINVRGEVIVLLAAVGSFRIFQNRPFVSIAQQANSKIKQGRASAKIVR